MLNNSEKDKSLHTLLEEIKLELLGYIDKRVQLFKLDAFEKGGISASILGYGLIVFIIVGTILFFSLIGLAFFLGELLGSLAAGFGILALFSLLVLLVILLNGRRIRRYILNKAITFMHRVEANDEQ